MKFCGTKFPKIALFSDFTQYCTHLTWPSDYYEMTSIFYLFPAGNTTNGIRTLSEAVSQREAANGKGGRHAVIRRHQSMYIHPRATELVPPSFAELPTFHMQEASGKSEVRPIVTLKRSKTTVGQMHTASPATSAVHYRGSATLQPPRTFRSNSVAKQMKLFDHNHNIYGTNKRKSHHYLPFDDICEFQVKYL